jgi:outer membrane protein OmpA-like peptidoglycan-associated protein
MSDYSTNEIAKESPNNATSDELSELRSLLLGLEPTKVNKLYKRLDDVQVQAEDISRLLPEAIILRSMQDKNLSEAIVSTIEDAIEYSVKKDLNILSETIFPVIGPATRKAMSTALDEMVQSLNQTLEHSLSPQSLKWRLEAQRTGKSFAEIVLLRTMVYRVEQIFLIHKKTGLLLQHILAPQVAAQDPDLVSAMLTAIQDFIKDSFSVQKGESLQSLRFGELTIWIEEGPQAILAGIIRGRARQELRLVFQEAIEKIHLKLNKEFAEFEGETEPFQASKPYLEGCLEVQYKSSRKQNYTYAWTFLGIIAIACGIWSFFTIRDQLRWDAYLDKLNSQPGIVVTKASSRHGKYFLSGMRDPLAVDPKALMQQANIPPKKVISNWEPYISLQPQFTAKRAAELLQSPETVSLNVDENGILHATGSAPRQWILSAQKIWHFIPGVTQFEYNNLLNPEFKKLNSYKKQIEENMLFFLEDTTELLPGEENKMQNLLVKMQKLLNTAKYLRQDVRIQIIGHENAVKKEKDITFSQARANKILSYITVSGIHASNFQTVAVGFNQPLDIKSIKQEQKSNSRVSFKVFLSDNPK